MKKTHNMIAVLAMFLLILALLITSFQIAIYGDSQYRFYEKEYEKYGVAEDLRMEMPDIMDVTDKMMAYLVGEREELSVQTVVDGREQDFFNEQDRLHMADVKNLFLGGLKLRWFFFAGVVLLIALLVALKGDFRTILPRAYNISLVVFVVVTSVLGILFASDFTKYFTIFHEIFFTNDLWMFDPATDLMIRMLPEGFFYDMVLRIGIVFLLSLAAMFAVFSVWKRRIKSQTGKERKINKSNL